LVCEGRHRWRQNWLFKLRAKPLSFKKIIFYSRLEKEATQAANRMPHRKFAIRSTLVRRTIVGQMAANRIAALAARHLSNCTNTQRFSRQPPAWSSAARQAPLDFNPFRHTPALARRLLLLSAVNEDCGSPDCFGHRPAGTQGQAQPLIEEAWRSRRDAGWLAPPCFRSNAVRKQDGE